MGGRIVQCKYNGTLVFHKQLRFTYIDINFLWPSTQVVKQRCCKRQIPLYLYVFCFVNKYQWSYIQNKSVEMQLYYNTMYTITSSGKSGLPSCLLASSRHQLYFCFTCKILQHKYRHQIVKKTTLQCGAISTKIVCFVSETPPSS